MRLHKIKIFFCSTFILGLILCFLPTPTLGQEAEEKNKRCCPLKFKSFRVGNILICCNGPNDENGFSEKCCTARDENGQPRGKVHTKSDGSKYCCKNKNPQKS